MSPRGRRPGGASTREEILEAARAAFAAQGFDRTSLRGIARDAGVDPALVHHYFDGKEALFEEVVGVPHGIDELITAAVSGPRGQAGERIVATFISVWDSPEGRERFQALVRAAATHADAAHLLRDFVSRTVLARIAAALAQEDEGGRPPSDLAIAAAGAQLVGLAMLRYVIEVPAMAQAEPAEVVATVAPTVQRLLVG